MSDEQDVTEWYFFFSKVEMLLSPFACLQSHLYVKYKDENIINNQ